jgi:hypothetical protein
MDHKSAVTLKARCMACLEWLPELRGCCIECGGALRVGLERAPVDWRSVLLSLRLPCHDDACEHVSDSPQRKLTTIGKPPKRARSKQRRRETPKPTASPSRV